jgi:hypothetical protein
MVNLGIAVVSLLPVIVIIVLPGILAGCQYARGCKRRALLICFCYIGLMTLFACAKVIYWYWLGGLPTVGDAIFYIPVTVFSYLLWGGIPFAFVAVISYAICKSRLSMVQKFRNAE